MILNTVILFGFLATLCNGESVSGFEVLKNGFIGKDEGPFDAKFANTGTENAMSVCLWIYPYLYFEHANIFVLKSPHGEGPQISLRLLYNELSARFSGCIMLMKFKPYIREWVHLCLSLSSKFRVYINGTYLAYECDFQEFFKYTEKEVKITIGKSHQTSTPFSGMLADIRIYWRELSKEEMREVPKLTNTPDSYEVVREQMEENDDPKSRQQKNNKQSYVTSLSIDKEEILGLNPPYILLYLSDTESYRGAQSFCTKIGGVLPGLHEHGNKTIAQLIRKFASKSGILITFFWLASGDNPVENCSTGYFIGSPLKLQESSEPCNITMDYFCMVKKGTSLKLIGFVDEHIELFPVPYQVGVFEATKKYRLYLEDENFYIKDITKNHNYYYVSLSKTNRIVGRHKWLTSKEKLPSKEITLTGCKINEFTCSDGNCIDFSKACDYRGDCWDQSDELRYCDVGLPPSEFYDNDQPPSANSQTSTELSLSFQILRIISISTNDNIVALSVYVNIKWVDSRLSFKFLSLRRRKIVSDEIFSKFWRPSIFVNGAVTNDQRNLFLVGDKVKVSALAMKSGVQTTIDSYEVSKFDGKDVQIMGEKITTLGLMCNMQLFYFPFDKQNCKFTLELSEKYDSNAIWSKGVPNISLPLRVSLALFQDISLDLISQEEKKITMNLSFVRKYGAYIFNTFLPCIVLEMIGLMTPLLPVHDYSDRVTVTLSCLIVMAALFTQVSNSLPTSAEPKLIDIWLFIHILVLLFVFTLHIIVIWLHEAENQSSKEKKLTQEELSMKIFLEEMMKYEPSTKKALENYHVYAWQEEKYCGSTMCELGKNPWIVNKAGFILFLVAYWLFVIVFGLIAFHIITF